MKRLGFIVLMVLLCICCTGCEVAEINSFPLTTERTVVDDMVIVAVPKSFFFYETEMVPDFDAIIAECAQYGATVARNDLTTFTYPATQWLVDGITENRRNGVPDIPSEPGPMGIAIHYPFFVAELTKFWEDSYLISLKQAQLQSWLEENAAQLNTVLSRFADNSLTSHMLIRDDLSVITIYADTVSLEEAFISRDIAELVQLMIRNQYLTKENTRAIQLHIRNSERALVFMQEHCEYSAFIPFYPDRDTNESSIVQQIINPVSVDVQLGFFDASPFLGRCETFEEIMYELNLLGVSLERFDNRLVCTMSQETLEQWKSYYHQKVLNDIEQVCTQADAFYDSLELSYSISDDFAEFKFTLNSRETGITNALWSRVSAEALNYRTLENGTRDIKILCIDKRDGFTFSTMTTG